MCNFYIIYIIYNCGRRLETHGVWQIGSCVPDVTAMKGCFWNVVHLDNTTRLYILFIQNLTDVKISGSKIYFLQWQHLFQIVHSHIICPIITWQFTVGVNDSRWCSWYNYQQMAQFPSLYEESRPSLSSL